MNVKVGFFACPRQSVLLKETSFLGLRSESGTSHRKEIKGRMPGKLCGGTAALTFVIWVTRTYVNYGS